MTNVETDRVAEAREAVYRGFEMFWLDNGAAPDAALDALIAAVRDQPESDAEVEAVTKCLQMNIGQRYHESWYRDMARFALAAAREARNA